MDGRSVAHIRYDKERHICIHRNEICNGIKCSCSFQGNGFFLQMKAINGSSYSCIMYFVDVENGVTLRETTKIVFDGGGFLRHKSVTDVMSGKTASVAKTTTVIYPLTTDQDKKNNLFNEYSGIWIAFIALIVVAVIVLLMTKIGLEVNRKFKKGKPAETDLERQTLLTNKCDSKGSTKTETTVKSSPCGGVTSEPPLEAIRLYDIPIGIQHNQKRWLLVGVTCFKVYQSLRSDIKKFFNAQYERWKLNNHEEIQSLSSILGAEKNNPSWLLDDGPNIRNWNGFELNYAVIINRNKIEFGNNIKMYDYNIKSSVEMSKMVIPESNTRYSNFDDSMSFESFISLLCIYSNYGSEEGVTTYEKFASLWEKWCTSRLADWDETYTDNCTSFLIEMSRQYRSSNEVPMTAKEIKMIMKNGITILDGAVDYDDHYLANSIVSYMEELASFLDRTQVESSSSERSKMINMIKEWSDNVKVPFVNQETTWYNCSSCEIRDRNINAVYWCVECRLQYCPKCKDIHSAIAQIAGHHFVDISLYEELPSVKTKCSKHEVNDIEYLCGMHDELCCRDCVMGLGEHRACERISSIENLKTMSLEVFHVYRKQLEELDQVLKTFQLFVTSFASDSDDEAVEEVLKLITKYQLLRNEFENPTDFDEKIFKENFLAVKSFVALKFEEIHLSDFFEDIHNVVMEELSKFESLKKSGSEKLMFLFIFESRTILNDIELKLLEISKAVQRQESTRYLPDLHAKMFKCILSSVEKLLDNYKKTDAQIVKDNPVYSCSVPYEIQLSQQYAKLKNKPTLNFKISGMASTPGNLVLLTSSDRNLILILDKICNPIGVIETSKAPYDIACAVGTKCNETVCVATCAMDDYLQFIDVDKKKQLFTIPAKRTASCGVTLSENQIIVGSLKQIKFLTFEGREIRTLDIEYTKGHIGNIISNQQELIFSDDDPSTSTVHCIRKDGIKRFSFEAPGLKSPSRMAVGKHGNIFILGCSSNNIFIISLKGKTLRILLPGEIERPVAMCFNNNLSKLVVADKFGERLRSFDMFYGDD